jgi:TonB family protein
MFTILLLNQHFHSQQFSLLQPFFHHSIKQRIMMLYSKKGAHKKHRGVLIIFSTVTLATGLIFQSGTKLIAQEKVSQKTEEKKFTSVEQMPEFPGGQAVLMKYLSNNLRYPESAKKANIQGRVIAQFVVNQFGKIERIEIKRGLSPECDAETIRVIKAMPAWKPAKLNGENVSVHYTLPVSFRLSS